MSTAETLARIEAQTTRLLAWSDTRIDGDAQHALADLIRDLVFTNRQIIPILQATRDDLVLLRGDIRDLRAALESPDAGRAERVAERLAAIEAALMGRVDV